MTTVASVETFCTLVVSLKTILMSCTFTYHLLALTATSFTRRVALQNRENMLWTETMHKPSNTTSPNDTPSLFMSALSSVG